MDKSRSSIGPWKLIYPVFVLSSPKFGQNLSLGQNTGTIPVFKVSLDALL